MTTLAITQPTTTKEIQDLIANKFRKDIFSEPTQDEKFKASFSNMKKISEKNGMAIFAIAYTQKGEVDFIETERDIIGGVILDKNNKVIIHPKVKNWLLPLNAIKQYL